MTFDQADFHSMITQFISTASVDRVEHVDEYRQLRECGVGLSAFELWANRYHLSPDNCLLFWQRHDLARKVRHNNKVVLSSVRFMIEANIDPKDSFFHDINVINVINHYQGECCKPCFVMNLSDLQMVTLFDFLIQIEENTSNRASDWLLSDGTPQTLVMPYALIAAKYGSSKVRRLASTMYGRKFSHSSYDRSAVTMIDHAKSYLRSARQVAESDQMESVELNSDVVKRINKDLSRCYSAKLSELDIRAAEFYSDKYTETAYAEGEEEKAINEVKALLQSKKRIEAQINGKHVFLFLHNDHIALKSSKKSKQGSYYNLLLDGKIESVRVYSPLSEHDYALKKVKHNIEMTQRYKQESQLSGFSNSFIAQAQRSNKWISPYANHLTTGCVIDGDIIKVSRVLNAISSTDAERLKQAINEKTAICIHGFKLNGRTAKVELFDVGDGEIMGNLVLGNSKEYAYLLINESTFIGYDID